MIYPFKYEESYSHIGSLNAGVLGIYVTYL